MDRTWGHSSQELSGALRQEFSKESAGPECRVSQGWMASLRAATRSRGRASMAGFTDSFVTGNRRARN